MKRLAVEILIILTFGALIAWGQAFRASSDGVIYGAGGTAIKTFIYGTDTFTTDAATDTVLISGLGSNDFGMICWNHNVKTASGDAVFSADTREDTLIVHRNASTITTSIAYSYLVIMD